MLTRTDVLKYQSNYNDRVNNDYFSQGVQGNNKDIGHFCSKCMALGGINIEHIENCIIML